MTSEEIVQIFYFLPKIGTFIFGLCGVRALPVAAGINVVAIVLALFWSERRCADVVTIVLAIIFLLLLLIPLLFYQKEGS